MFNLFGSGSVKSDKKIVNLPAKDLPIKMLTAQEVAETVKKRIAKVQQEFIAGFSLVQSYPKSVTFFGSARLKENDPHYAQARRLGNLLAKEGYAIITGGGPGIMEAGNRGAYEAGGASIGLNIELPMEQSTNPYITAHEDFYYFFTRKVCMTYSSEAFVYFPGGFGTLDELFEILTLVQTKKIPWVPIILVGVDFWKPLTTWIDNELRTKFKTIDDEDTDLYHLFDDEQMVVDLIKESPIRN
ncbi:MAG: Cytokinin riboside 5-monophosphate phosphoribohydrolase [Patescibacteria group bacterium]|nr:Cytokinin riboside 5-monophosphate phosphoribohydrolase [Patescibacteria group bacterium]